MLDFLLRGVTIGLLFGVPLGATGALSLQRTLERGFWHGLITGLGSSTADVFYASVGLYGLTAVSSFLQAHSLPVRWAGSALMAAYGLSMLLRTKNLPAVSVSSASSYLAEYASALGIALLNPAAIISMLVAFSAFGVADGHSFMDEIPLVLGIFIGTAAWWVLLGAVGSRFRKGMTASVYRATNRVLGCVMLTFAGAFLLQSLI